MAINSTKDLVIGKEYFLKMYEKDYDPDKVVLENIEYPTSLFPELAKITVQSGEYNMDFFVYDIGIGETKEEVITNFKRIK